MRFDLPDFAAFDIHILQRRGAAGDYPEALRDEAARRFAVERAEGRKRRRDAAALDAVAAAVIIDRWLSSPDDATPIP